MTTFGWCQNRNFHHFVYENHDVDLFTVRPLTSLTWRSPRGTESPHLMTCITSYIIHGQKVETSDDFSMGPVFLDVGSLLEKRCRQSKFTGSFIAKTSVLDS
jgi:hypothetical protein